jgi:hypothetical protein
MLYATYKLQVDRNGKILDFLTIEAPTHDPHYGDFVEACRAAQFVRDNHFKNVDTTSYGLQYTDCSISVCISESMISMEFRGCEVNYRTCRDAVDTILNVAL